MNTHHIIITGASRGIGQAIALLYASMGWNISICCRHKSPDMEHTKAQITAAGGPVSYTHLTLPTICSV